MRGFTARKIWDKLGIEGLAVFVPIGRTGGDHGPARHLVLQPADQLGTLSIMVRSAAKSVSNTRSESQAAQRGGQLPGRSNPHRHAEFLSDRGTDGGSRLHHHMLRRIVDGIPHFVDTALLVQRTGRAGGDALSTVDARRVGQTALESAPDRRLDSAAGRPDCARPSGFYYRWRRSGGSGYIWNCRGPIEGDTSSTVASFFTPSYG